MAGAGTLAAQGQAWAPSCAQWASEGPLPGISFRWCWGCGRDAGGGDTGLLAKLVGLGERAGDNITLEKLTES